MWERRIFTLKFLEFHSQLNMLISVAFLESIYPSIYCADDIKVDRLLSPQHDHMTVPSMLPGCCVETPQTERSWDLCRYLYPPNIPPLFHGICASYCISCYIQFLHFTVPKRNLAGQECEQRQTPLCARFYSCSTHVLDGDVDFRLADFLLPLLHCFRYEGLIERQTEVASVCSHLNSTKE